MNGNRRPISSTNAVVSITLLFLVLASYPLSAQDQRPANPESRKEPFRGRLLALLQHPKLFSDLQLSPLQRQCIRAIETDMMLELDLALLPLQKDSERTASRTRLNVEAIPPELLKVADETDAIAVKLILVVLTPQQQSQFNEIRIRWDGPLALRRSEFRQSIGLTESQFAKVRAPLDELVGQVRGKKMPDEQRRRELIQQIMSRIPPQQRTLWERQSGRIP